MPGSTAFTVTPRAAFSAASVLTIPSSPAFDAAYATCPGRPDRAAALEITTIRPCPRERIPPRHARTALNAPVRFTPMSRAHCSSVIRWAGAIVSVTAAFDTHTSTSSNCGSGSSDARSNSMSQPGARSSVTTSNPSARRRSAIAAPIPRAAPVTSAFDIVCRSLLTKEEPDGRALVHRRGAARDGAADDGPGDRGARPRRRGDRTRALRGDEARVALAARPDGGGNRGADQLRAGEARGRRRCRGVALRQRAWLEARRADDRVDGPARGRAGARGYVARALGKRHRPLPGRVHDHGGRREAHVRDEPVRLGAAARAQRPLRRRGCVRDHERRARLELRPQGLPALLHPLH